MAGRGKGEAAIPDLGLGTDTLFYRLMRLVNMTAKPFFTDFAARYDLTINEWRVMLALTARPGLSVQEIADLNGFDKMSASRAVRRLIARGRAVRTVDPDDKRRTRHSLSPAGAAIVETISPFAVARVDAMFGTLTGPEVAQLKRILDKLERHAARDWAEPRPDAARPQRGGKP